MEPDEVMSCWLLVFLPHGIDMEPILKGIVWRESLAEAWAAGVDAAGTGEPHTIHFDENSPIEIDLRKMIR